MNCVNHRAECYVVHPRSRFVARGFSLVNIWQSQLRMSALAETVPVAIAAAVIAAAPHNQRVCSFALSTFCPPNLTYRFVVAVLFPWQPSPSSHRIHNGLGICRRLWFPATGTAAHSSCSCLRRAAFIVFLLMKLLRTGGRRRGRRCSGWIGRWIQLGEAKVLERVRCHEVAALSMLVSPILSMCQWSQCSAAFGSPSLQKSGVRSKR